MTIFSKTFYCGGTFNGQDQVPAMINGAGQSAAPVSGVGIEPWETVSINVVCVDIEIFQGSADVGYAFAGNGYSPDVMRFYGQPNPIPAGEFFPFPAATDSSPPHIDLHISGAPVGNPFQAYYVVYYTKNSV